MVRSPRRPLVVADTAGGRGRGRRRRADLVLESMKMETVLRAPSGPGSASAWSRWAARSTPAAADAAGTGRRRAPRRGRGRPGRRVACRARRRRRRRPSGRRGLLDLRRPDHRLRRRAAGRAGSWSPSTWPPAASAGGRPEPLPGELDLLTVFADLCELTPQQAGQRRGGGRRAGAQPARVLPQLPAEPRRRARRRCRRASEARLSPGARALRRRRPGPHARRWRTRSSASSWPSSGCRPTSRSCRSCCDSWLAGPPPPASLRERAGRRARPPDRGHPAALPGGRRPGPRRAVPLLRAAAAAPQPGRGRTPRCRADLRSWTAPDAAGPRPSGSQALVASPEPLIRLLGQRIGAPAAPTRPVLEVLTRRYYRSRACRTARVERRRAAGSSPPSYGRDGHPARRDALADIGRPAGTPRRASAELAADAADRGWSPTSTSTWPDRPGRRRDGGAARASCSPAARCRAALRRVTVTVAGTTGAAMHHH